MAFKNPWQILAGFDLGSRSDSNSVFNSTDFQPKLCILDAVRTFFKNEIAGVRATGSNDAPTSPTIETHGAPPPAVGVLTARRTPST